MINLLFRIIFSILGGVIGGCITALIYLKALGKEQKDD